MPLATVGLKGRDRLDVSATAQIRSGNNPRGNSWGGAISGARTLPFVSSETSCSKFVTGRTGARPLRLTPPRAAPQALPTLGTTCALVRLRINQTIVTLGFKI